MAEINYSKKQITPIIEKYCINPDTNTVFKTIIAMFDGQTNYQIWALKAVFGNVASIDVINHIKQFADENQTLIAKLSKGNLVSYKTKEDFDLLNKEMEGALAIVKVKHGIAEFNTKQREMLTNAIFGNGTEITPLTASTNSAFKKHVEMFTKLSRLNEARRHKMIVLASAIEDIDFLFKHINDTFSASYAWDKEDMLYFIANNKDCKDVKVVFNNGPIVVLEIPNFKASKTICGNGRTAWCLTREENYFNNYVTSKAGNRQFFYFDFSKDEKNDTAHVGFTVNPQNGIVYAHSTNNNDICHGSIRVGGASVNVNTILAAAKIDKKVFIHLNGIKGFNWNLDDVLQYINKNSREIAICANINGRIIVKALTREAFSKLCGNTLVNANNLPFGNNNGIYVILDLNVASDDDKCMVTMTCRKDDYGGVSVSEMYDAYNQKLTAPTYFAEKGLKQSDFLGKEQIAPSVLLHKYINEMNTADAVALIKEHENDPEFDVNFTFKDSTPVYFAIKNRLFDVFTAIVSSSKFNANTVDEYDEPILSSLIYDYRIETCGDLSEKKNAEMVKKMIGSIISSPNYDFNAININNDTAIGIACERTATNWIFDALVANPNVNVNVVNDVDRTVLGNAIVCKNIHAIELLLKRPDIVVTENDRKLASENGINLDSYIQKSDNVVVNNIDAKEYAKAFAQTFAKF